MTRRRQNEQGLDASPAIDGTAERRLATLEGIADMPYTDDFAKICIGVAAVLATNRQDLPFTAFYRIEHRTQHAVCVAKTGIDGPWAPALNSLALPMAEQGTFINADDLAHRFGPMPSGPSTCEAAGAMIFPLYTGTASPVAFFVAGVHSGRELDHGYRRFFDLVTAQISARLRDSHISDEEYERMDTAAARENALRYTSLTSAIPHIVLETTPDGKLIFLNQRFAEYTGLEPETAYIHGWAHLVHPEDLPLMILRRKDAIERGLPFLHEFRLLRKDGEYRWHYAQTLPQRDESGRLTRWAGTITDIDDKRRAEKEQHLLAEAGRALAGSLESHATFGNIVHLLVPDFSDWCRVDLKTDDGRIQTVAFAHRDPAKNALAQQFVGGFQLDPEASGGAVEVIRNGETKVLVEIPKQNVAKTILTADDVSVYSEIGYESALIVPIKTRGTTLGAITYVYNESGRRYSQDDVPAAEELSRRAALAIDNARLFERERRVAETFQEASLPPALPKLDGVTFDAVYIPGSSEAQVGGDWYDAVRLLDGRIVVSIGDVAGSGLGAAVTMGNMRQIIRGIAQVHADPALMLDAADRALRLEHGGAFATAFVGVFDPVTLTFAYASAGHPPPMLRHRDGSIDLLSDGGLPLGLREGRDAGAGRYIEIDAGSSVVFYTDGLTEFARDPAKGERRLQDLLRECDVASLAHPAQTLQQKLMSGEAAHDDVAVLVMHVDADTDRTNPLGNGLHRRWSFDAGDAASAQSARREFGTHLLTHGASAEDVYGAEVVFGELVGNVVRYASGNVDVRVDWNADAPVLHVLDQGRGFQHLPLLPSDVYSESGRGLFIVSSLTRDFHVSRRNGGGSHARAVLSIAHQSMLGNKIGVASV